MTFKTFSLVFCGLVAASASLPASAQTAKRGASRGMSRAGRLPAVEAYRPWIEQYGQQFGVDPDFIAAVMTVESRGNPNATSSAGAMGLMQLMPGTARDLGVANAYDPEENIRGGSKLLSRHLKRYKGDLKLTLAAYNAGPRRAEDGSWVNITETRRYVSKILGIYQGVGATETSETVTIQAPPVVVPMPAAPKINFLDLMFNVVYESKSSAERAELIENSGLDKVADSLLADHLADRLDLSNVGEAARQAASLLGVSGEVAATVILTPDELGFKGAWQQQTQLVGKVIGLAHSKKGAAHVWIVVMAP